MKSDVMEWMINTQLGRRNLPPQQRIAVVKKFEKKIQEQAKITQGTRTDLTSSPNGEKVITSTRTDKELAKLAGVSTDIYSKGKKILDSDDEELKQEVLSGEKSINASYKELTQRKNEGKTNTEREVSNISSSNTTKSTIPKTQISEETKQICADMNLKLDELSQID